MSATLDPFLFALLYDTDRIVSAVVSSMSKMERARIIKMSAEDSAALYDEIVSTALELIYGRKTITKII